MEPVKLTSKRLFKVINMRKYEPYDDNKFDNHPETHLKKQ